MTIDALLKKIKSSFKVDFAFDFPVLYVFVDAGDEVLNGNDGVEFIADFLSLSESEVARILTLASAELYVKGIDEDYDFYLDVSSSSSHWLALNSLDKENECSFLKSQDPENGCRAIHFYGYKGGQARSSVLGVLAKSLAEDGYRVLAIDVDFEAPSLPQMFQVSFDKPESTVYGACQLGMNVSPKEVHTSALSRGRVDLIAARPRGEEHDIGYSAFLLRSMLYYGQIQDFVVDVRDRISKDYDVVLFDHRTGLSFSLLPVVSAWPGSTVMMSRIDSYESVDRKVSEKLFSLYPSVPGAFVSFCLDTDISDSEFREKHSYKMENLLDALGSAIELGAEQEGVGSEADQVSYETLSEYWVNWFYDRAFLIDPVPDIQDLGLMNKKAIENLRACISLLEEKKEDIGVVSQSSLSGASDEGAFIQTDEIAKILSLDSGSNFVLGRKGTGKTRLAKEILSSGGAKPILLTNDLNFSGIKSNSSEFEYLNSFFDGDYCSLWWALFYFSLELKRGAELTVDKIKEDLNGKGREFFTSYGMAGYVESVGLDGMVNLVIDGVETAVSSNSLREFVEGLLRFMMTVQTEDSIRSFVNIKLFIRSDLVEGALENVEQLVDNNKVFLSWDQDSIFNFFLSRVAQSQWFQYNFRDACKKIEDNSLLILKGRLQQPQYLEIISEIFPAKLKRNNIQTFTFLKSYFSDSGIEAEKRATFYPRLYIYFIDSLVELADKDDQGGIEGGRLRHDIVLDAHQKATSSFMKDVHQELSSFVNLEPAVGENKDAVSRLISSFAGRKTPFDISSTVNEISKEIGYDVKVVDRAVRDMARFGIFEPAPKKPKSLRAGQMYKTALNMKYVRSKKG